MWQTSLWGKHMITMKVILCLQETKSLEDNASGMRVGIARQSQEQSLVYIRIC